MRSMKYVVGWLAFAGVALGAPGEGGVTIPTPKLKFNAQYTVDADNKYHDMVFERRITFDFPGAKLDPQDPKKLKLEQSSTILQINKDGSEKFVDCRLVAKGLVETLVGYNVDADADSGSADGETRKFSYRGNDPYISALIARNLDKVTVKRSELPDSDCKESVVPGIQGSEFAQEKAMCGDLTISYRPRENTNGPLPRGNHRGEKYYVVFDANKCAKSSSEMSAAACETLTQADACGMRYVLKGINKHTHEFLTFNRDVCKSNPANWSTKQRALAQRMCGDAPAKEGLSEKLQKIMTAEYTAREEGYYAGVEKELKPMGGDDGEREAAPPVEHYERYPEKPAYDNFQPPAGAISK